MRLKLMKSMVLELKKQLSNAYPEVEEVIAQVPVEIFPHNANKATKNQVMEKVGAPPRKRYSSLISGEFISGTNGVVVVIYQKVIRDEKQFAYILLHELGHVLDNNANTGIINKIGKTTNTTKLDDSRPYNILACGYAIWSEFIADSLMYRVIKTTFEPSLLWETLAKDHIISRDELCFGRGDFLLGWLQLYEMGKYFALALHLYGKEDHIEATDRELGLDIYKPEIASLVRKMLDTLCNQLAISNYWKISESTLELLGELYKDMEFFYKNDYGEERLESMCENDFDKLPFP